MASPVTRFRRAFALAALLGVACGTGAAPPLAPRPAATLQPPAAVPSPGVSGWTGWTLKRTLTSLTGSLSCGCCQHQVGTSTDYSLAVRRSGTDVTFNYGNVALDLEDLTLVGILDGEAFTASTSYAGSMDCRGWRPFYEFEARVAGQFSADGNAIAARETWTERVASGDARDAREYSFDWAATRLAR